MCTLYSFFSSRPSEVRLILKSPKCCTIQHKFVPARSVERNIEKIRFPWASNSKFVIFSQIFPRSNYKICPIIPRLFPVSNGDSPVSTTFPRSNYRGFFTTGESYCTMYTLCIGVLVLEIPSLIQYILAPQQLRKYVIHRCSRICTCRHLSGTRCTSSRRQTTGTWPVLRAILASEELFPRYILWFCPIKKLQPQISA